MSGCTWKAKGTLTVGPTEVSTGRRTSVEGAISVTDGIIRFYANEPSLIRKLQSLSVGQTVEAIGNIRPHSGDSRKPYFLTLLDINPAT